MGVFSWIKSDTQEAIYNDGGQAKMLAPDGREWKEYNYQGYGVFGGKDYYELLAELNGLGSDRVAGINLYFGNKDDRTLDEVLAEDIIIPKLVSLDFKGTYNDTGYPEIDPDQGCGPDETYCCGCDQLESECTCDEVCDGCEEPIMDCICDEEY